MIVVGFPMHMSVFFFAVSPVVHNDVMLIFTVGTGSPTNCLFLALKMICNDFLVVKVNCSTSVSNIIKSIYETMSFTEYDNTY